MNALTRDRLLRALKDAPQTASVRVRLVDEEVRELSRGGPKTPWRPILQALDELPWTAVELLDRKGALIGAPIKNDAAATEMENLPSLSSRTTEVGQLAQIVTHSVRGLSELVAAQTKPAFDALTQANRDAHELAGLYRERAEQMERERDEALARERKAVDRLRATQDRMTDVTEQIASVREQQPETWQQVVQAAPQVASALVQLAPLVKGLLGGGSAPAAAPRPPIAAVKP